MKKLLLPILMLFVLFACNDSNTVEDEIFIQKEAGGKKYGPIGCIDYENGVPVGWGIRCRPSPLKRCKRETPCMLIQPIIFGVIREHIGDEGVENWVNYPIIEDSQLMLILHDWDPTVIIHPDSIE